MSIGAILLTISISAAAQESEELQIIEQPGYVPTPEEEMLPAQYRPQPVYFRSNEPPGTIVIHTQERFLYMVQGRPRDPLRHRRRPRRLPVAGPAQDLPQAGVAGLAPAARDDRAPALPAALHGRRAGQSARARARSISARRCIAFTAPTSRGRSAMRSPRAASGWSIAT